LCTRTLFKTAAKLHVSVKLAKEITYFNPKVDKILALFKCYDDIR